MRNKNESEGEYMTNNQLAIIFKQIIKYIELAPSKEAIIDYIQELQNDLSSK